MTTDHLMTKAMKMNILSLLGLFSFSLTFSQGMLKEEKLGLVSYLITVKYMSEYKMASIVSESNYDDSQDKLKTIQGQYNSILINVNKLINQLSADLIVKNNLNEYRKINKFVNKSKSNLPKRFSSYIGALQDIDRLTSNFLTVTTDTTRKKTGTNVEHAFAYSDIAGIGTLAKESITNARDFRVKKIGDLVTILKEFRLKSISELSEQDEP